VERQDTRTWGRGSGGHLGDAGLDGVRPHRLAQLLLARQAQGREGRRVEVRGPLGGGRGAALQGGEDGGFVGGHSQGLQGEALAAVQAVLGPVAGVIGEGGVSAASHQRVRRLRPWPGKEGTGDV